MGMFTALFAQSSGTSSALIAFVIYTILVFVIAAFAGRLLTGGPGRGQDALVGRSRCRYCGAGCAHVSGSNPERM